MRRAESSGMLFALAGFALLSVGDGVIKTMAGEWPSTAIAATRYLLGAVGLGAMVLMHDGPRGLLNAPRPALQWLRGLSVSMATLGFFSALFVMPITAATTITFTSPIITTILAAVFLGEVIRRSSLLAIAMAFTGVLIVLRPNFADLGWAALLPMITAFGMSMLFICNRMLAGQASGMAMQAWLAMAAAPILIAASLAFHASGLPAFALFVPDLTVLARCAFVAVSASGAHWLIYLGTTRAGAGAVAPMVYVQLLVVTLIGWLFFGEMPDAMVLLGAGLIVLAGVYLWHSDRKRSLG